MLGREWAPGGRGTRSEAEARPARLRLREAPEELLPTRPREEAPAGSLSLRATIWGRGLAFLFQGSLPGSGPGAVRAAVRG